ncbi:hypothetical protein [Actinomadura sp. NTSP31]|uniref:hypothetical protein n=1 Tax=Actinomadura sp. NTSP31 TaxID=1735447 RepID=UPI0035BEB73A
MEAATMLTARDLARGLDITRTSADSVDGTPSGDPAAPPFPIAFLVIAEHLAAPPAREFEDRFGMA